jgi:lipopolysaccharide biosynthesis regulator YciM/uncharacterized integral membrane protein
MVKRFLGFIVLAALLIGVGLLFWWNPTAVDVHVSPSRSYHLPLPLLVLASFFSGAAAIFLLALVREAQWTFFDWRRRRREAAGERKRATIATGRELLWRGRAQQAKRIVGPTVRRHHDLDAIVVLAETSISADRLDEARAAIEEGLSIAPEHPRLLALLATVTTREGSWRAATTLLERAVAGDPRSPRLLAALRDAYVRDRRWAEAVGAEERYVALLHKPEEMAAERRRELGLRYEMSIDHDAPEQWVGDLYAVLRVDPAFVPAAVALGDALVQLGRPREAGRVWLRAVRRRPVPVLLARVESLFRESGRVKKVLALYERLRRRGDTPLLRDRHARLLLALGAVDQAAAVFDSNGAAPPSERQRLLLAGEIARARGRTEDALAALRAAFDASSAERLPHVCSACGRAATDWAPSCPGCGTWDTLEAAL